MGLNDDIKGRKPGRPAGDTILGATAPADTISGALAGADTIAAGLDTIGGALDGADTVVAAAGTAGQVALAAADPVVIGAARTPVEPGGPGVGAAQTAREATGFVTRPLTEGVAADLGLRPLSDGDRAELEELRRRQASHGFVVDAADIPGRRLARAATQIQRDGVLYAPGTVREWVPVDFAAYTELVEIGAITDMPWGRLDHAIEV